MSFFADICIYIEWNPSHIFISFMLAIFRLLQLADHRGYIKNEKQETTTGEHFNSPGHSLSDLKITVLEVVKKKDDLYRKEREKYFIRQFNTFYDGLNRQQ